MLQTLFNDENQKGLLVYAPFFITTASLFIGLKIGLLALCVLFVQASIIFFIRNLIPSQQCFPVILIVGISLVIITKMLLDAEVYSEAQEVSLLFPLILMNSLVLSYAEKALSTASFKTLFFDLFHIGIAIVLLLMALGLLRTILSEVSIFSSTAGCLLLLGFLFSMVNFLKTINKEHSHIE